MPKPYPTEFRDDVVRVARNREPGVTIEQIAKDFGVHSLKQWEVAGLGPAGRVVTGRSSFVRGSAFI